jgi:hypothetical protein
VISELSRRVSNGSSKKSGISQDSPYRFINMGRDKTAVIGLGGGGTRVVEELRLSSPDQSNFISLDFDAEVFGDFFRGYCADVYPVVQSWVGLSEEKSIDSWFDRRGHFSQLRELPDIFVRCTTRPIMRAALLMHIDRVRNLLAEILDVPEDVQIVCQTDGATGTAWVLDIAELVRDLYPDVRVRIVLIAGELEHHLNHGAIRYLSNSYWTCREISSHEQFGKDALLFQTSSEAINYLSNILTKISNQIKPVNAHNIEDFQYHCAQQFFSSNQNSWDMERFFGGRCRSVSALIADAEKESLTGLLVAHAENRVETNSERTSWDFLQITARDSDELFRITVPRIDSPGASFISLALTDRGFGDQVHVESIAALQSEGVTALNDNSFVVTNDYISQLQEIRSQILQRLDFFAGAAESISLELRFIGDVYPVLLDLLESLLKRLKT